MLDKKRVELEIARFKTSFNRKLMFAGERYYRGEHDILKRKRTVIGENGELKEVNNLPNNRIVDNQYKKMVNQKVDYLLAKPLTVECDDKSYLNLIRVFLIDVFRDLLKLLLKILLIVVLVFYLFIMMSLVSLILKDLSLLR